MTHRKDGRIMPAGLPLAVGTRLSPLTPPIAPELIRSRLTARRGQRSCEPTSKARNIASFAAFFLAAMLSGSFVTAARGETAEQWLRKSQTASFPGRDCRARFRLVIELADGTRLEREGLRFRRNRDDGLADCLFVLRSPDAVAGVALLSKDQPGRPATHWAYFPAHGRPRRVGGHGVGGAYVGSDFDYADLGPVRIEAGEHRVTNTVEVGGHACIVIETKKHPDLPFYKRVSMLDRENALPVRVEYYDEDDRLTKVATLERVAKIENWPTPVKISMTNKVTGSHSTIELDDIRYDVGLEPGLFTVGNLETLDAQ